VVEKGPVGLGNISGGVVQDNFHYAQCYSAPAANPDPGR
jgi:hypothetical protein